MMRFLVCVDQKEITYDALTEYGKGIVRELYRSSDDYQQDTEPFWNDELEEFDFSGQDFSSLSELIENKISSYWFEDNIGEYDLFYELGLEAYSGNMYCSDGYGYCGVHLCLNDIDKASYAIQDAVESFKKIVDLQPVIFSDLLVW